MASNTLIAVTESHLVVAEGNFVLFALVGSEGFFGPTTDAYATFYDMFRVQDGRLVEHWDVSPNCRRT